MELQLDRCVLRSFRPGDAPSIAEYADNRKVWQQLRDLMPHPYRLEDAETYLEHCLAQDPQTVFTIDVEGRAVGVIGVTPQADINRCSAEIGYWLGEPYWGRGIVTEAVAGFTSWAMEAFALERVFALPFSTNPASCRVLEKAGFTREGVMRRNAIKDGVVVDQVLYAVVRSVD